MWHRLVCLTTGGLALCSAKKKLNRAEAISWIEQLRNVADDIQAALEDTDTVLDAKGRRVVGSGTRRASRGPQFFNQEGIHEVRETDLTKLHRRSTATPSAEKQDANSSPDVEVRRARVSRASDRSQNGQNSGKTQQEPQPGETRTEAADRKVSGPRVATRKQQ